MRWPFCGIQEDKVIDSRVSKDGRETRRRRECDSCQARFTTYERIEESLPLVAKSDGRREPFDRNKIYKGLKIATNKRSVTHDQLAALAEDVKRGIPELGGPERASRHNVQRGEPRRPHPEKGP